MRNNINMVKELIKSTKPMFFIQIEPETNPEFSTLSSSTPVLPSIPETPDPILDGSDEEEEHPEAQAQALRYYQLARDRFRRVPKDHPRGLPLTLVTAEADSEGAISDLPVAYSRHLDAVLPLLDDRSFAQ
ncbi:hypothetical protein M9H77_32037 [Catharanthus roseus]|uniref:Uncharacterized protein n=1 Tax=Catharanthus roseus TaxID=4058 RepID=A0ACC0A1R3_CATRO|nr:hypothetical protein M9H77_32037 [Catharanthus roseus]